MTGSTVGALKDVERSLLHLLRGRRKHIKHPTMATRKLHHLCLLQKEDLLLSAHHVLLLPIAHLPGSIVVMRHPGASLSIWEERRSATTTLSPTNAEWPEPRGPRVSAESYSPRLSTLDTH